jgi:hypothetical protein
MLVNFDTVVGTPTMNALASELATAYNRHALHFNQRGWNVEKENITARYQPACVNYVTKQLNRQVSERMPVGQPFLGF